MNRSKEETNEESARHDVERELTTDEPPQQEQHAELQRRIERPHRLDIARQVRQDHIEPADDHDVHGVAVKRILTERCKEPTDCRPKGSPEIGEKKKAKLKTNDRRINSPWGDGAFVEQFAHDGLDIDPGIHLRQDLGLGGIQMEQPDE